MALKTQNDIITEVLVRNNRSTTDSFITDAMLQGWYFDAHTWASSLYKWPFTEGRVSTTWVSTEEWSFEGYKSDSFRIVTVGGYQLKKLNFRDYLTFREKEPTGTDRVFSDYGGIVFINPYLDVSGTLTAWGQYTPYLDVTDYTAQTLFSGKDEEGNEALVEKMTSYLKRREHEISESELHDTRAGNKLAEIWKRVLDEQALYQTHPDTGGMFERFDVLNGGITDELFNRDQFN